MNKETVNNGAEQVQPKRLQRVGAFAGHVIAEVKDAWENTMLTPRRKTAALVLASGLLAGGVLAAGGSEAGEPVPCDPVVFECPDDDPTDDTQPIKDETTTSSSTIPETTTSSSTIPEVTTTIPVTVETAPPAEPISPVTP